MTVGIRDLGTKKIVSVTVASASANISVIAAASSKYYIIIAGHLNISAAGTLLFEDGSGGTELGRWVSTADKLDLTLPWNPDGWFETTTNKVFNIDNTGTATVSGWFRYVEA